MQQRQSISQNPDVMSLKSNDFTKMDPDAFLHAIDSYKESNPEFCLKRLQEFTAIKSQSFFEMIAKTRLSQTDQFNMAIVEGQLSKLNKKCTEVSSLITMWNRVEKSVDNIFKLNLEDANNEQIADAYKELQKAKDFYQERPKSQFNDEKLDSIDKKIEEVGSSYLMATTVNERKALFGNKFEHFENQLRQLEEQYGHKPSSPSV